MVICGCPKILFYMGVTFMRMQAAFNEAQKMDRPVFLTPAQVAATGLLSLYAVRKGIADHSIPFVMVGSHFRINYTKLLEQMNKGC